MTDLQFDYIKSISNDLVSIFKLNPDVADFIGSQFALESAYGTSKLAVIYNNHCGMRNPLARVSTAITRGDAVFEFAHYDSKYMCVLDYILCITFHKPLAKEIDNVELFKTFIKKFYCPEKGYLDKVNSIYQQFKLQKNGKKK